jgi:hypothetical protein
MEKDGVIPLASIAKERPVQALDLLPALRNEAIWPVFSMAAGAQLSFGLEEITISLSAKRTFMDTCMGELWKSWQKESTRWTHLHFVSSSA